MSNGNCHKYRNGDPGRRHCSTANQIGCKINYLYVAFSLYLPNTCLSEIIAFPHLHSTSSTLFLSLIASLTIRPLNFFPSELHTHLSSKVGLIAFGFIITLSSRVPALSHGPIRPASPWANIHT